MSDWRTDAACRGLGPSLFYADGKDDQALAPAARRICATCPVADHCLEAALAGNELFGIWAGTSARERLYLRRRRRLTRAGSYATGPRQRTDVAS